MVSRCELTKDQALYAIENGEFGEDVLSHENVIVIMHQYGALAKHAGKLIRDILSDSQICPSEDYSDRKISG